ncbi:hypothetical protein J9303_19395 [Bacillaceae bacterium Marseille-Q3522]|nr:hypothetical protein [Bacillaceae bacterium Marseille-Q3522]
MSYLDRLKEVSESTQFFTSRQNDIIERFEVLIAGAEEANDETVAEGYRKQIANVHKGIAFARERAEKITSALEGFEQGDWLPLYEYQLFENRFYNMEFETGNIDAPSLNESVGQFTVDVSMAEKHWLMERNIQPVFAGEFTFTIFHQLHEEVIDEFKENNRKIDHSGLFSLYNYFENFNYFIPMILFLFLLGGGFASERGKKNTLHFLKTQPISLKNIFLGKVMNATSVSVCSCMTIFGFIVLIGSLFNRFGDWAYPILHYDHPSVVATSAYTGMKSIGNNGFHFIPLGEYLVQSIGLFLLCLLFLLVLTIFLSLFFKNQLTVFTTAILIAIVGYFVSVDYFVEMAYLSPFTYFNIHKIMNGELSILFDNPSINIYTGSFVLLSAILILLIVGYLLLMKREKSVWKI